MAVNSPRTRKPRAPKKPPTLAHAEPIAEGPVNSNNPPPLEQYAMLADDLYAEAENWLDGEPIGNATQAEQVTLLIASLEKAAKEAEAQRGAEKKPHWDAGKAVDAAWSPVKEKLDKALRTAKRAMTPWLEQLHAEQQRKIAEAQAEARAAEERLRQQAIDARTRGALADEDVTEALEADAKAAARDAGRLAKETAVVRAGGKTLALRDVWLVNVTDHAALLKHYKETAPDHLKAWLFEQAQKDVRGGARHLPGCSIWSEKKAV